MPTFPDTAPEPPGLPYGLPNLSDKIDLYDRICFSSWEFPPTLPSNLTPPWLMEHFCTLFITDKDNNLFVISIIEVNFDDL